MTQVTLVRQIAISGTAGGELPSTGTPGNVTGNPVAAGDVGESFNIQPVSGVTPGSSTAYVTIVQKTLQPGVYMLAGSAYLNVNSATGLLRMVSAISTNPTSVDAGGVTTQYSWTSSPTSNEDISISSAIRFVTIGVATTYYLLGRIDYSTLGTASWSTTSQLSILRIA